jgi:hypothetical protein
LLVQCQEKTKRAKALTISSSHTNARKRASCHTDELFAGDAMDVFCGALGHLANWHADPKRADESEAIQLTRALSDAAKEAAESVNRRRRAQPEERDSGTPGTGGASVSPFRAGESEEELRQFCESSFACLVRPSIFLLQRMVLEKSGDTLPSDPETGQTSLCCDRPSVLDSLARLEESEFCAAGGDQTREWARALRDVVRDDRRCEQLPRVRSTNLASKAMMALGYVFYLISALLDGMVCRPPPFPFSFFLIRFLSVLLVHVKESC